MKLADQPHHRLTIDELTTEQVDALLEVIREKRLKSVRNYAEAQHLKDLYAAGKTRAKLDKKLKMFEKLNKTILTQTDKLEKYAIDLKTLMLELSILGERNAEIGNLKDTAKDQSA
jgi:hypothetical protein